MKENLICAKRGLLTLSEKARFLYCHPSHCPKFCLQITERSLFGGNQRNQTSEVHIQRRPATRGLNVKTETKLLHIIAGLNELLKKVRDLGTSLLLVIRVKPGQADALDVNQ